MHARIAAALALLGLLAGACGGDDATTPGGTGGSSTAGSSSAVATTAGDKDGLAVEGKVAILVNSYGLPNTTGYTVLVAFHVKNASNQTAVRVPFRATVAAGGKELGTTGGSDTVTVGPRSTRLVVIPVRNLQGTRPETASVTLYADKSLFKSQNPNGDPSKWIASNVKVACDSGAITCVTTGDLKWTGDKPQRITAINVAWRKAADEDTIIGAGSEPNSTTVNAGQTIPFQVRGNGFDQPRDKQTLTLPAGPLTSEIYVESAPSP